MKKIIIFIIGFILSSLIQPAPAGAYESDIDIYGKITEVGARARDEYVTFTIKDALGIDRYFSSDNNLIAPMIVSAYHTQTICRIKSAGKDRDGYNILSAFALDTDYDTPKTNDRILVELKEMRTRLDKIEKLSYYISRYINKIRKNELQIEEMVKKQEKAKGGI